VCAREHYYLEIECSWNSTSSAVIQASSSSDSSVFNFVILDFAPTPRSTPLESIGWARFRMMGLCFLAVLQRLLQASDLTVASSFKVFGCFRVLPSNFLKASQKSNHGRKQKFCVSFSGTEKPAIEMDF